MSYHTIWPIFRERESHLFHLLSFNAKIMGRKISVIELSYLLLQTLEMYSATISREIPPKRANVDSEGNVIISIISLTLSFYYFFIVSGNGDGNPGWTESKIDDLGDNLGLNRWQVVAAIIGQYLIIV